MSQTVLDNSFGDTGWNYAALDDISSNVQPTQANFTLPTTRFKGIPVALSVGWEVIAGIVLICVTVLAVTYKKFK